MAINKEVKESIPLLITEEEYIQLEVNIKEQISKNDLSLYKKAKLVLKLEEYIKIKFKGIKAIAIDKELGKIAKLSNDTIHKVRIIEKEATVMQIEELSKEIKSVSAIYKELRHPKYMDIKPEIIESKKCNMCGITKPISAFRFNTCNTCRRLLFESNTDTKIIREKLKKFANVDLQEIYEKMKQPIIKKETNNNEIKNEIIVSFNQLLNKFDTDINKYVHMKFVFKVDNSSSLLVEKLISELEKILKMMGV